MLAVAVPAVAGPAMAWPAAYVYTLVFHIHIWIISVFRFDPELDKNDSDVQIEFRFFTLRFNHLLEILFSKAKIFLMVISDFVNSMRIFRADFLFEVLRP